MEVNMDQILNHDETNAGLKSKAKVSRRGRVASHMVAKTNLSVDAPGNLSGDHSRIEHPLPDIAGTGSGKTRDNLSTIMTVSSPTPHDYWKFDLRDDWDAYARRAKTNLSELIWGTVVPWCRLRRRWQTAYLSLLGSTRSICHSYAGAVGTGRQGNFQKGDKIPKEVLKEGNEILEKALVGDVLDNAHFQYAVMPFLQMLWQYQPRPYEITDEKSGKTKTVRPKGEFALLEDRLLRIAPLMPGYKWAESVKGFGVGNFIYLVGEIGNLADYPVPMALLVWLGIGTVNGERQRRVSGDPAKAKEMRYRAERHAVAWRLGSSLMQLNWEYVRDENGTILLDEEGNKVKRDLEYRQLYLQRKEYELARMENEDDPGRPKSPMHAHRRAMRYMTQRALIHLWQAWRKDLRDNWGVHIGGDDRRPYHTPVEEGGLDQKRHDSPTEQSPVSPLPIAAKRAAKPADAKKATRRHPYWEGLSAEQRSAIMTERAAKAKVTRAKKKQNLRGANQEVDDTIGVLSTPPKQRRANHIRRDSQTSTLGPSLDFLKAVLS
jgi:hypothetical protein